MATYIKADYEKILSLKEQMRNIKTELMDEIGIIKDAVDKMDNNGSWRGDGYESYRDKMAAFKWNFDAYIDNLSKLVSNLDEIVEKYKKVDKEVINMLNS